MAKKIKVKRSGSRPAPVPVVLEIDTVQIDGWDVSVGDVVKVRHISSGDRWLELEVKRISTGTDGHPVFSFYSSPPGWITVTQGNLKRVPTKRKKKTDVIED